MIRRHIAAVYDQIRAALREWVGDAEYERYLRRCAGCGEPPLERGRFFAQRLERRYGTGAQCC